MANDPNQDSEPVNAPINSFLDYYTNVNLVMSRGLGSFYQDVQTIPTDTIDAFAGTTGPYGSHTSPFREGQVVAFFVNQYFANTRAFFQDLTTGLACIADAARVIGDMYHNTDIISALGLGAPGDHLDSQIDINGVNFAFADPGANAPTDMQPWAVSTKGTYQDQQAGPPPAAAPLAEDPSAAPVSVERVDGSLTMIMTYADGSKRVTSMSGNTTTETIIDGNGTVISTTTTASTYAPSATVWSETTTKTTGDEHSGTSETTTITHNADGSVTVVTETDTWYPNPDPKAANHTVHVTTHDSYTQQPDDPGNPGWQGPVEQAERQYGVPDPGGPLT